MIRHKDMNSVSRKELLKSFISLHEICRREKSNRISTHHQLMQAEKIGLVSITFIRHRDVECSMHIRRDEYADLTGQAFSAISIASN